MVKNFLKKIGLFSGEKTKKTEFESGVIIERRRVLWLPVFAAAALISPRNLSAYENNNFFANSMSWDDFLKECLPKSAELHKNSTAQGQDAYLFWIASMAARLNLTTFPKTKLSKFKNLDPPAEFGVGYRGVPFFVVEWKMSPNAHFPPHNHPNVSVCTVGMEGEARIRNFEVVGDAPEISSDKKFNVRETHNELISAGRINALSAKRDNIHTFQVGKDGARGIDITTYHGKDIGFSFLDIQEKTFDAEKRLFEANWKKL
jgi:hypothetical protein